MTTHAISPRVVCIDASNIRAGGGVTHLRELLLHADPQKYGIARIVVFGSQRTLDTLVDKPWLVKRSSARLNAGLLRRLLWQFFDLDKALDLEGCDLLFVPGGSYVGPFRPMVAMSQNLLPFERKELARYRGNLRYILLRLVNTYTLRRSDGAIFLTDYGMRSVLKVTGPLSGDAIIIPHGSNTCFDKAPRIQWPIERFNAKKPFRLLYVSIIDLYKHQWNVVLAVSRLREKYNWPLVLDLVGPAYPPALKRLNETIDRVDPHRQWVHYHGAVLFEDLDKIYAASDVGVFASSCETFGIILLEMMRAGLPICCSNHPPLKETLMGAGCYFDPENIQDISDALFRLIESPKTRTDKAHDAYSRANNYSWDSTADMTLQFISGISNKNNLRQAKCAGL